MILKSYLEELEQEGLIRKPYEIRIGPVSNDNVVEVTVTEIASVDKAYVEVVYEGEEE